MANTSNRQYSIRSKLHTLVRLREIELGRRITIGEIAEQTQLSRNTISSWLSPDLFGRVDSDAAIKIKRWADCTWEELLEEVELEA